MERDGEVGDKRDFSLPSLCLVGRVKEWKSRGIENFFIWLRRKWDDWKCSLYKFTRIPLLDKFKKKKKKKEKEKRRRRRSNELYFH